MRQNSRIFRRDASFSQNRLRLDLEMQIIENRADYLLLSLRQPPIRLCEQAQQTFDDATCLFLERSVSEFK